MGLELEVKDIIEYPEGKHEGKIVSVEHRKIEPQGFEYIDVHIQPKDKKELNLKYGVPAGISKKSKLGKLLETFGIELRPHKKVDLEEVFVSKQVSFHTILEGQTGFIRIVDGTLKPL